MNFIFGYDEKKIKPYLKMAVQRLQIATNKKSSAVKHAKREIAKLLEDGKEEKARIKVEHIIREDFVIEGYEVLTLLCDLLHERIRLISTCETCPPDLFQTVCSLIWAEKNVSIEELGEIRKQLVKKFGKEFGEGAESNKDNCVSPRLYNKLVYSPPSKILVLRYLDAIAEAYKVDWKSENSVLAQEETMPDGSFATPTGFSIPMAPGTGLSGAYGDDRGDSTVPMTPAEKEERAQFLRNQLTAEQREGMSPLSGVPSHYNPPPLIGQQYQQMAPPAAATAQGYLPHQPHEHASLPYQQPQQPYQPQPQQSYQPHQPYQPQQPQQPQQMQPQQMYPPPEQQQQYQQQYQQPYMTAAVAPPDYRDYGSSGSGGGGEYAAAHIPVAEAHALPDDDESSGGTALSKSPHPASPSPPPATNPAATGSVSSNMSMQSLEARMAALRGGK